MPRARTGSVRRMANGDVYARVTWTDGHGNVQDRKRKAMDETHARSLCVDMLKEIAEQKRFQPQRLRTYCRKNLLIYFIQLLDGNLYPIKIGTTNNIQKRMKMVLTHQPYEARLLATWSGSVADERSLHAMFSKHNIAREWFRPDLEILTYIAEKTKVAA